MKAEILQLLHHAVIFDLDGVITKTAIVHAHAWKKMFDSFLKEYAKKQGADFVPFDTQSDYLQYVDGKPRYEGIKSFLESREIELPIGDPSDSLEQLTICGLGTKKNQMFIQELDTHGVEVYQSTIDLIKELRGLGIKTALISSSKNCLPIIKKLGYQDLFDFIIDGLKAEEMQIKGKPHPDIFLEAANMLGVEPKHAVVVEDAISGVQAGREGKFNLVIGVDRQNQSEDLLKNGANVVVKDLKEVTIVKNTSKTPNALENFEKIKSMVQGKKIAVFLDYDGTLTPIVSHPDLATLDKSMLNTLQNLSEKCVVAIISGRDRENVKQFVGLENIFYAGSHGFDISGPNDERFEIDEGKERLPELEAIEHKLREEIPNIERAWVERKKFAIAVHFRESPPEKEIEIEEIVKKIHSHYPKLRVTKGKKIFEIQPNIPWNKGKALNWLRKLLDLDKENVVPIYIGDDVTDEDAFRAIIDDGLGIVVQKDPKTTYAKFSLKDCNEVQKFLTTIMDKDEKR